MRLKLSPHFQKCLPKGEEFDYLMRIPGEVKRHVLDRETLGVVLGGEHYFIKRYRGCGWREIFKEGLQGRQPVLGADREWHVLNRLARLGIAAPKPVGFGLRGLNPARRESFLVTEALLGMITLEDLTVDWGGLRGERQKCLKQALLKQLADLSHTLHSNGINHRDYYLCHFLLPDRDWLGWQPTDPLRLHLIDFHRAQMRNRVPERWQIKDLGSLLFSALDADLTAHDLYVFAARYRKGSVRSLRDEAVFWRKVFKRAVQLYRQMHGKAPHLPGPFANFA